MSIMGGFGDLDGLECRDIADGDREEGKDERDVRRLGVGALPLELPVVVVSVVPVVPLVVGRCCMIATAAGLVTAIFAVTFTVGFGVGFGFGFGFGFGLWAKG